MNTCCIYAHLQLHRRKKRSWPFVLGFGVRIGSSSIDRVTQCRIPKCKVHRLFDPHARRGCDRPWTMRRCSSTTRGTDCIIRIANALPAKAKAWRYLPLGQQLQQQRQQQSARGQDRPPVELRSVASRRRRPSGSRKCMVCQSRTRRSSPLPPGNEARLDHDSAAGLTIQSVRTCPESVGAPCDADG